MQLSEVPGNLLSWTLSVGVLQPGVRPLYRTATPVKHYSQGMALTTTVRHGHSYSRSPEGMVEETLVPLLLFFIQLNSVHLCLHSFPIIVSLYVPLSFLETIPLLCFISKHVSDCS